MNADEARRKTEDTVQKGPKPGAADSLYRIAMDRIERAVSEGALRVTDPWSGTRLARNVADVEAAIEHLRSDGFTVTALVGMPRRPSFVEIGWKKPGGCVTAMPFSPAAPPSPNYSPL